MKLDIKNPDHIEKAADWLRRGYVVVIPTETVYGLAADATQDAAVAKIFAIKNRPIFNPLILHFSDQDNLEDFVLFSEKAKSLARAFWPGPLTLVLPRRTLCKASLLTSAGGETLGVRIPAVEGTRQIIKKVGRPLAAPSANPSERLSSTLFEQVESYFGKDTRVKGMVDDGGCPVGLESTILDLSRDKPEILRVGAIPPGPLEQVLRQEISLPSFGEKAQEISSLEPHPRGGIPPEQRDSPFLRSPGQMRRHYAPLTPLRLNVLSPRPDEALLAFGPHVPEGAARTLNLSPTGDLQEAAANLFRYLYQLDQKQYKAIAVMPIPSDHLGLAINDRLVRATSS